MAVNWLKGLVAPAAQFGTPQQPGMPPQPPGMHPDAPPVGGAPNPYGAQPPMQPQQPMQIQSPMPGQGAPGLPDAMQWSTGTRTQGAPQGGASGLAAAGIGGGDRVAVLEARCAELGNDVASLALFARTLLTVLEEAKVVTRDQFMETKNKLDALDGKLDDR